MKPFKAKFKRVETKYLISKSQLAELNKTFEKYMVPNVYAHSTISNIYYDTPNFQMIRNSLEKPDYKEKLRVRSYDAQPTNESEVYVEVKKKFQKVVYKRRLQMTVSQCQMFLNDRNRESIPESQIRQEIEWLDETYNQKLEPKMFIYYDRYSLQGIEDEDLRITFDYNLKYRADHLELTYGNSGTPLIDSDYLIMEIKSEGAFPIWLARLLSTLDIYKTSFSKYGRAYLITQHQSLTPNEIIAIEEGEIKYA